MVFWLALIGVLYLAFQQLLAPKPAVLNATGELVLPRQRDGHFYAAGTVNGRPVQFLVDTGASYVTVSESTALAAGLEGGEPVRFSTANGTLEGRIVAGVPVGIGGFQISATRVAVGLNGVPEGKALLGQNVLSRFDVVLSGDTMTLRPAPR